MFPGAQTWFAKLRARLLVFVAKDASDAPGANLSVRGTESCDVIARNHSVWMGGFRITVLHFHLLHVAHCYY